MRVVAPGIKRLSVENGTERKDERNERMSEQKQGLPSQCSDYEHELWSHLLGFESVLNHLLAMCSWNLALPSLIWAQ